MAFTIEQEQAAFDAQLPELLSRHRGEFVLFKDLKPIAFYRTHQEAYSAAIGRYGPDGVFLVAFVEKPNLESVSLAWDAGVAFG